MSGPTDGARAAAMQRLPVAHALALQLLDDEATNEQIAERLGIEPEAVRPLLAVAEAKLAALLEEQSP
ncbi:MAG: hypothetical protein GEV07_07375 [Streptosporangiales bacterium]|nr:hypothetical protein [Streptosporangiales bacterium]